MKIVYGSDNVGGATRKRMIKIIDCEITSTPSID